jgi:hypothetical protein
MGRRGEGLRMVVVLYIHNERKASGNVRLSVNNISCVRSSLSRRK